MDKGVRPFGHGGNAMGERFGQRRFIGHGRHLFLPQIKVTARKRTEIRRRFRHGSSILPVLVFDQPGNALPYCSAVKNILPFGAIAKTLIA
jgi:hypothetical protein